MILLMAQRIRTLGIAIQRYLYRETSQILHFLTADHGRVAVVAKGAFREKNSYQGPIDLLVRGEVRIHLVEGRGLGLLTHRSVESAYPGIRRDLSRFAGASHLLSLVVTSIPVGAGDPASYQLFDRALRALESQPPERVSLLILSFENHYLKLLGLAPHLESCIHCGGVQRITGFLPAAGGVVCKNCRRSENEGISLTRPLWELWQQLRSARLDDIETPSLPQVRRLRQIMDQHLAFHMEWPTPSAGRIRNLTRSLLRSRPAP